jgi:acyl-CoA thioester hydrolase
MLNEHEVEIRVRYQETDPMGFLHHSQYFTYFEIGRTEMLRASGGCYRRMEEQGLFVVVVRAECRYHKPARYDDVLRLRTKVVRTTEVKIEHEYELLRGNERLAVGHVTLAILDREGQVRSVSQWIAEQEQASAEAK